VELERLQLDLHNQFSLLSSTSSLSSRSLFVCKHSITRKTIIAENKTVVARLWKLIWTPWSPPLIDFQSSRRPPDAMCYCRRSVVCYCQPSTLEQSTCRWPVCLVTHNISSAAENSFISAILPRHCVTTTSP